MSIRVHLQSSLFRARRRQRTRPAFALVLVLVAVAMIALAAYTLTDRLVIENETARLSGQQLQARAAVDSGVSHVLYLLETPAATRLDYGGLYQNPSMFQGQLVVDHELPRQRVRFGVISPMLDQQGYSGGWRWGLEDESARINVNTLQLEDASSAEAGAEGDAAAAGGAASGAGGNATGGATSGGASSGGGNTRGNSQPSGAATSGNNANAASNNTNNRNSGNSNNSGGQNNSSGNSGGNSGNAGGGANGDTANQESEQPIVVDASGRSVLMKLPGMTVEIADAILDWIDTDEMPREFGAEIDEYSQMSPPYAPRNGPIETIEELLLVRGITPEMLFGRDVNRNGFLDVAEQNLPMAMASADGDPSMDLGWASMLTVFSQERNVNQQGVTRINLNGDDLQQLYDDLSAVMNPAWAKFIVAYRQRGPYAGTAQNTVPATDDLELDLAATGGTQIANLLDLIGAKVEIPATQQGGQSTIMESPFSNNLIAMSSYLPVLMDQCTVKTDKVIMGRVNINQASRAVLLAVPGLTEEMVDGIISQREMNGAESSAIQATEAWILASGIVTLAEMKAIQPYITARGDVYRAQIIGYFDEGEIASRVEAVFDASSVVPRLLSWRDISHLGRGYARETLGVSGMSSESSP